MALVDDLLSQSIVVMFFFYAGYGIYKQIKARGIKYIREFPKRRLFTVWLMFAFAICSFLLLDVILGRIGNYDVPAVLLSFTGWTSVGNSNWFMFATFAMYVFVIVSFNIFNYNYKKAIGLLILLTMFYSIAVIFLKDAMWMDTVVCFPLGMLYACYQKRIEGFLKNNRNFCVSFFVLFVIFIVSNIWFIKIGTFTPVVYSIVSCSFALLIVMFTMKVKVGNKILGFFGKYVFWIYILQRIPMIVLKQTGLAEYNSYIYFATTLVLTVVIAVIYNKLFEIVKKKIIK